MKRQDLISYFCYSCFQSQFFRKHLFFQDIIRLSFSFFKSIPKIFQCFRWCNNTRLKLAKHMGTFIKWKSSASKSSVQRIKPCAASSFFFILAGWHSKCFWWQRWQFKLFFKAVFILVTLFTLSVVQKSCVWFCNSWSHLCFSMESRLYLNLQFHRSIIVCEPVIDWALKFKFFFSYGR